MPTVTLRLPCLHFVCAVIARLSCTSGASIYFDAFEAEAPGGFDVHPSPPPSTSGTLGTEPHTTHGTSSPAAGSSPRHTAAGAGGSSSPFAVASTPGGSLSVGPQSCSRSQLSGFTLGPAHGPGAGTGRHAELHEVDAQLGPDEELQRYESSQPRCGCHCVIS